MHNRFDPEALFYNGKEQPLDRFAAHGGFCRIFRSLAIFGDSLSAGEFESEDEHGNIRYTDMYDHAWGTYLGRMTGIRIQNFSRGGMTALEYLDTWAEQNGFWNISKACQGYVLALGVNDLFYKDVPLGTINDAKRREQTVFSGQFAEIVRRYQEIQPAAKFFFLTMPQGQQSEEQRQKADAHAALMREMSRHFANSYVIDLRKYAPCYDRRFRDCAYLNGHLNPMGYAFTSDMIATYIDFIIRHNPGDFKMLGFIGSG